MRLVGIIIAIALATPTFWLGLLLILYFSVSRHWLPASGYVSFVESPRRGSHASLLPALTLGAYGTAVLIRFLSTSITDALQADYVRVAYAKGLRERSVVIRHALKVALPPVVTIMAIQFGQLLGGAVVTESVFGWPGLGRLILDGIAKSRLPRRAEHHAALRDDLHRAQHPCRRQLRAAQSPHSLSRR